jgi:hypothetical protein
VPGTFFKLVFFAYAIVIKILSIPIVTAKGAIALVLWVGIKLGVLSDPSFSALLQHSVSFKRGRQHSVLERHAIVLHRHYRRRRRRFITTIIDGLKGYIGSL